MQIPYTVLLSAIFYIDKVYSQPQFQEMATFQDVYYHIRVKEFISDKVCKHVTSGNIFHLYYYERRRTDDAATLMKRSK